MHICACCSSLIPCMASNQSTFHPCNAMAWSDVILHIVQSQSAELLFKQLLCNLTVVAQGVGIAAYPWHSAAVQSVQWGPWSALKMSWQLYNFALTVRMLSRTCKDLRLPCKLRSNIHWNASISSKRKQPVWSRIEEDKTWIKIVKNKLTKSIVACDAAKLCQVAQHVFGESSAAASRCCRLLSHLSRHVSPIRERSAT